MISKELLSEVLGVEPIHIEDEPIIKKEYIVFKKTLNSAIAHSNINIYELAHKCKEWAKTKGWYITSWIPMSGENGGVEFGHSFKNIKEKLIFSDTEPEAIFKACEWILEQKATI